MTKLDKDAVLENFIKAYSKANGNAPSIEAKGGWYSVDGGKNVRLAQLEEMTATFGSAATKPKAEKKTPEKKKAAPAKKAKNKTFSVKDFYTQQILDANPGATAPR